MERTAINKEQSKSTGLAETLFSDYRRRILALLLLRPDEHYHVREIYYEPTFANGQVAYIVGPRPQ